MPNANLQTAVPRTTGLIFTGVVSVASLACVAFALCDLWSYNKALDLRFIHFASTVGLVMAASCGVAFLLATRLKDAFIQETISRRVCQQELSSLRGELEIARRNAGMAEFAAGVLHNVGNVINSVNVSATNQSNLLMSTKLGQLERVIELMEKDNDELVVFLKQDEKGKQLPRFMRVLFDHLMYEKRTLFEHSQSLIKNVDHLKSIISTQQAYAYSAGLLEPVEIETLFEDAVNLHCESFTRHGIKVERNYASLPPVLVDKQRVMQIVINLVKNAKEAMHGQRDGHKVITLSTQMENDHLLLQVSDTGMGIEKHNLPLIFTHGFTTKASGHGFGLNSCATAATEMEGSLTAKSPGPGEGATFTLCLPFKPAMSYA
jgi:two-component system, NtrC family, sensor kinase